MIVRAFWKLFWPAYFAWVFIDWVAERRAAKAVRNVGYSERV